MQLTFLQASQGRRLSKVFQQEQTLSYPQVKNVSSILEDVVDTKALHEVLTRHADLGHALHKGPLARVLVNEPRKGQSVRDALTQLFVLDFDNVRLPDVTMPTGNLNHVDVMRVSEALIAELPPAFHNVSYVAQASASFGMKPGRFSLHLFFILREPMAPAVLKQVLQYLNFSVPGLAEQLELTASGGSLHYPLDIVVADNARIVYISPPMFDGVQDPFSTAHDRIVQVGRAATSLYLASVLEEIDFSKLSSVATRKINALRKAKGLEKKAEKIEILKIDGNDVPVVTNPDRMLITVVADEGRYLRLNVNGGDSGAYYVDKERPTIVNNFKGEPPFVLERADPELYQRLFDDYSLEIRGEDGKLIETRTPVCFRDMDTNVLYAGFTNAQRTELTWSAPITRSEVPDFFTYHGSPEPGEIPQYKIQFDPTDARSFDMKAGFVNKYLPPDLWREATGERHKFGQASTLRSIAPTIAKVIHSAVGSDDEEFEHFVNWLAMVCQTRRKVGTSWVLHGTQGTGKGVLFSNILRPLLGERYCSNKTVDNIIDPFDDWNGNTLLVLVDEFRFQDGSQYSKLSNKLKHYISEENTVVRVMHRGQFEVKSYTNFIFASNEEDAVQIPDGDRRFHVAARQEFKLFHRHPDLVETLVDLIEAELPAFAGFIKAFAYDEKAARTVRETKAKQNMRDSSMNTADQFCKALHEGDLDFFVDYLMSPPSTALEYEVANAVRNVVKRMVAEAPNDTFLSFSELRALYTRIMNKSIAESPLGKMLKIRGLDVRRVRRGPHRERGIVRTFVLREYTAKEIIEHTFTEQDLQAFKIDASRLH